MCILLSWKQWPSKQWSLRDKVQGENEGVETNLSFLVKSQYHHPFSERRGYFLYQTNEHAWHIVCLCVQLWLMLEMTNNHIQITMILSCEMWSKDNSS